MDVRNSCSLRKRCRFELSIVDFLKAENDDVCVRFWRSVYEVELFIIFGLVVEVSCREELLGNDEIRGECCTLNLRTDFDDNRD